MTYQEATEKSFQVKWKVGTCSQGEECWCRTIKPIEPILYEDGGDSEYYVVGMGQLDKKTAEHFVKLHNQTFGDDNKRIEADVAELAHKTYPFSNSERNAFLAGYNKFHIENREHLREQQKKELKELMARELLNQDGSPMRNYTSPLLEELHKEEMEEQSKGLDYWKNNAEEDYMKVPISVLRYIGLLEKHIEESKANHKTEHGKTWDASIDNYKARGENFVRAWEDFDDYYNDNFNKI